MIFRLVRDRRGSQFLETLFVLPVVFMLFFMVFETGFIMYDWASVNYAAASAAVNAAKTGRFSHEVRSETADYIRSWTTNGERFFYDETATGFYESNDTVVVWGTDPGRNVERNGIIVAGVAYPVKFKVMLIDRLWRWIVQEETFTLKAQFSAKSEVHF